MARPLRLEFSGALYHVTSRGDRREDIYRNSKVGLTKGSPTKTPTKTKIGAKCTIDEPNLKAVVILGEPQPT